MMTLFSLIADQVRKKSELFEDEGKIMQALLNNGYRLQEAHIALTLMQTLVNKQAEAQFEEELPVADSGMRLMNREERIRFGVDAFGFVTKLTNLGLISEEQREELLDRAMAQYPDRIDLDQIKSLVAFTLFVHQGEQEGDSYAVGRRVRKTSWN